LARAFEPSAARRLILDTARITGWSPSEAAKLTLADLAYYNRKAREARDEQRAAQRAARMVTRGAR
jgi:hypothetical protein